LFLRRSLGYHLLIRGLSQERGDSLSYGTELPRRRNVAPPDPGVDSNEKSIALGPMLPVFIILQAAGQVNSSYVQLKKRSGIASLFIRPGPLAPQIYIQGKPIWLGKPYDIRHLV
jgi:hypothetical protein